MGFHGATLMQLFIFLFTLFFMYIYLLLLFFFSRRFSRTLLTCINGVPVAFIIIAQKSTQDALSHTRAFDLSDTQRNAACVISLLECSVGFAEIEHYHLARNDNNTCWNLFYLQSLVARARRLNFKKNQHPRLCSVKISEIGRFIYDKSEKRWTMITVCV